MKPSCFRLGLLAAVLLAAPAAFADGFKPGAKAPEIKVAEWVKGQPFKTFETSDYTVVEFWATWCGPCIEAIPHVTELSKKYKDKINFYGVSVWENGDDVPGQVKTFVKDMGEKMDYNVARDTAEGYMAKEWMSAANQRGIPASFLIDKSGTLLWVGHPMDLEPVLEEVTTGKFDLAASIKKFEEAEAASARMDAVMAEVAEVKKLYAAGQKDEALAKLDAIDTAGDTQLSGLKKSTRIELFMSEPAKLGSYVDTLIKEGGVENSQILIQISFMLPQDASKELKDLAVRGIEEGVKLDPKNPLAHLMAGYGWSVMGDKTKALAACEAGEKLLPTSEYKDDESLKKAFAELKAQSK